MIDLDIIPNLFEGLLVAIMFVVAIGAGAAFVDLWRSTRG